jgi:Cytochrome P450
LYPSETVFQFSPFLLFLHFIFRLLFPFFFILFVYRWSSEYSTKEKLNEMEDSFLAFGYGPRVCPGQALVQIEGVAALAALVRSFNLKLACPESEILRVCDFVTKANKLPVYLTPRL